MKQRYLKGMVFLFILISSSMAYASGNNFIGVNIISYSTNIPYVTYEYTTLEGKDSFQIAFSRSILTEENNSTSKKNIDIFPWGNNYSAQFDGGNKKWKGDSINLYLAYHGYIKSVSKGLFWGPRVGIFYTKATFSWEYIERTNYYKPLGSGAAIFDYATEREIVEKDSKTKVFIVPGLELGYKWILPYGITISFELGQEKITGDIKVMNRDYPFTNKYNTYINSNLGLSF